MIEEIRNIKRYEADNAITAEQLKAALEHVLSNIDENLKVFTYRFPDEASKGNIYPPIDNVKGWGTGFWTGIIWLAYEVTGNEKYRKVAEIQLESFRKRIQEKIGVNHHDMGFLFCPSCVAAYKLTGNKEARETALMAAEHLITRYREKGEFIQAWGKVGDTDSYHFIIDCLMNLPLLYWATEVSGDEKYYNIAYRHMKTVLSTIFRENGSTYHSYYFDPKTGAPLKGATHQGYSKDSCWSRGQAWGIYGLVTSYAYTKESGIIDVNKKAINYYLSQLPEDFVSYWDLIFTSGDELRDTSTSAISVCGILEMNKWLDNSDPMKTIYNNAANQILKSLINNYTTKDTKHSNGLLLHAVYAKPQNVGVDECNIWGDYYYMEALVRMSKEWKMYW